MAKALAYCSQTAHAACLASYDVLTAVALSSCEGTFKGCVGITFGFPCCG